MKNVKAIIDLG